MKKISLLLMMLPLLSLVNAQQQTINFIPKFSGEPPIDNSVIYQSGSYIGIGTTTPLAKFQVGEGVTKVSLGDSYGQNIGWGTSYIGFNALKKNDGTWETAGDGGSNGGSLIYGNIGGGINFSIIKSTGGIGQANILDEAIFSKVAMVINGYGNVGIGTTTPNAKLDISGVVFQPQPQSLLRITENNTGNMPSFPTPNPSANIFEIRKVGGYSIPDHQVAYSYPLVVTGNGYIGIGTNDPKAKLHVIGNSYFNGKVGVGTISPQYKLDVCGTIHSKEVIIENNNWCDFVFDSKYQRMTWQEKLTYINTNKHLPAIPSGKEIETNGLKTGEIMQGMIQNIEENTLDVIDLYQIIKKQNEEIIELKKEVEQLKEKK